MPDPAPTIITSPATPVRGHRKRGSIASPITPTITSPTGRKWSNSITPQHTSPLDFDPPHLTSRHGRQAHQRPLLSPSAVSADPFSHPQIFIAGILSTIVLTGTMYSIFYNTSLDTSVASLSPPRSAYLAQKSNIFNQLFVKKSWGWTTLVFISHWISSPPSRSNRQTRLISFGLATMAWIMFSGWFFGASLNHRLIEYSGGQCAISIPRSNGLSMEVINNFAQKEGRRLAETWGDWVLIPISPIFCNTGKRITRKNSPGLFGTLERAGVTDFSALTRRSGRNTGATVSGGGLARWHAGFDISGHMFLLTLSSLILARELAPSWRQWLGTAKKEIKARRTSSSASNRNVEVKKDGELGRGGLVNRLATLFGSALICLWAFMLGVTSIYFHNPPEKLAGLTLGLIVAGVIYLITPTPNRHPLSSIPARTLNALSHLDETAASDSLLSSLTGADENAARRGGGLEEAVVVDDDLTPTPSREEEGRKDR